MSLATHVELVDAKEEKFCAQCGSHLVQRFSGEAGTMKKTGPFLSWTTKM